MLFYTHIMLGMVFFLSAKSFLPIGNSWILFLLVLLGSVLPDIDERHSKINRWSGIIGTLAAKLAKHRGFFHSFLFIGIIYIIVNYFFNWQYGLALFIGFLAHMVGDGVTLMGIKPFKPFSNFRIHGPLKVGGMVETVILVGLIVFVLQGLL